MPEISDIVHLKDLWDEKEAASLAGNPLALLRYRSNLLGADLRITNFGGGNTSSKFELPDPFTGKPASVLAVKGSGGDLGSIQESGFALLYLDRLEQLKNRYRGEQYEDEMVDYYPLCAFGQNRVAASIDTPLHAFVPAPHVDHLHPDWAIAIAAAANGKQKLEEFNRKFGRKIVWLPWLRRCSARQPRPLYLGQHPARVLSEQHPHHRPDGRVHSRASEKVGPCIRRSGSRSASKPRRRGRSHSSRSARHRFF